jgi:hypothetical protein
MSPREWSQRSIDFSHLGVFQEDNTRVGFTNSRSREVQSGEEKNLNYWIQEWEDLWIRTPW